MGTGKGTTVLEVLKLFEKIIKQEIPMSMCSIRPGDIARSVCNVDKIKDELKWEPKYTLEDAIKHLIQSREVFQKSQQIEIDNKVDRP